MSVSKCGYWSKILQGTLKNTPILQVPVQEMDHYLQLMVQKVGHQPQKWAFLRLMGQILGHQPRFMWKKGARNDYST